MRENIRSGFVRKFEVFEGGDLEELNKKSIEFQKLVKSEGGRIVTVHLKHLMKRCSEEQIAGGLVRTYEYDYAIVIVYEVPEDKV